MKTILLFLFLSFFFSNPIQAASTNKKVFPYEITSIVMNHNEIIVKGWGMGVEKHHYDSVNSHYYTLELNSSNHKKVYQSKPLYNSQTEMMKVLNTRRCNKKEYYKSGDVCYYNYDYVGFQFHIPLSDLTIDSKYETKLKVHSNILSFNLSADVFYPIELPITIMKDTIEYKIKSNLYDTELIVAENAVFDRTGPSKNHKIRQSKTYCSNTYGYSRFFEKGSVYKYVYERVRNQSNTYYRIKTSKDDVCKLKRNVIHEGNDYDSWIASNWVDYAGDGLVIQVTDTNQPPRINILSHPNISIYKINDFNFKNYINAYDNEDGNITNKVKIMNQANLNVLGTHSLKLEVEDKHGKKASETLVVNVIDTNTPPILDANDKIVYQYEKFDYLKDVKAYDLEDKDITHKIYYEGNVNTSKLGKYTITYYVSDSKNKTVSKTILVEVVKNPKEKIRYISNRINKIFYKENIPLNWKENIHFLIDQIENPKNIIKKTLKY